jgi:hypothetical protein
LLHPHATDRPLNAEDVRHAAFLALVPRLQTHGQVYFRHLKPAEAEEAIADMVALAWKWFVRLAERGKDARDFPAALATFAARAVNDGRRLCGQDKARDVMSRRAQRLRGFTVERLPDMTTLSGGPYADALADNTRSPVPEQVAFRLDFPAWRLSRAERDRRIIDDLMVGERTLEVANRHGLSPGRVSQLRREFLNDWRRFCGEDDSPWASTSPTGG